MAVVEELERKRYKIKALLADAPPHRADLHLGIAEISGRKARNPTPTYRMGGSAFPGTPLL